MAHKLGVSGSTILSNPRQFKELFWDGIEHIEIGEFPDEAAFEYFLQLKDKKQVSFGIHSPIIGERSKYDLVERVWFEPEYAWNQLKSEAMKCIETGAEYLLVHFPYFKGKSDDNPDESIEHGLKRLKGLQDKYSIPIICEPKLGFERSTAGINYMNNFSIDIWKKYGLGICIDIGDYIIAADDKILSFISKWKDFIKVVHLHNVYYSEDKYIWTPVHPSQEEDEDSYSLEAIIRYLSEQKNITFIFEHTPHMNPGRKFVDEGYMWVRELID